MDYGAYAPTYATARWAVPWVLAPLAERVEGLRRGARVLEIGCGTGNYLEALGDRVPERHYHSWRSCPSSGSAIPPSRSSTATPRPSDCGAPRRRLRREAGSEVLVGDAAHPRRGVPARDGAGEPGLGTRRALALELLRAGVREQVKVLGAAGGEAGSGPPPSTDANGPAPRKRSRPVRPGAVAPRVKPEAGYLDAALGWSFTASRSSAMATSSPTAGPASTTLFQVRPKSLREILVVAEMPRRSRRTSPSPRA